MLIWIVSILFIYLIIGVGFLVYWAKEDGYVLSFWWLILIGYPYLIAKNGFRL